MQDVQLLSELFPTANNQAAARNPSDLGQKEFLTLLVAQLKNQNPTKPQDNMEFISQIAQFGTVTGIQDLQKSFSGFAAVMFANQGLQAASLVGRQVLAATSSGALGEGGVVEGSIWVPGSTHDLTLYVHDEKGALVDSLVLGEASKGDIAFRWDGLAEDGNGLPPGNYTFSADALLDGKRQALVLGVHNRVESVTVDRSGAGVYLNLDTGEQINIAQVDGFK